MQFKKYPQRTMRHLLSTPFIYAMVVPLTILDICLEIYHRVCFPLYGIPYVSRNKYIKIDRQKLSYLSWVEKINCAYCGYANGLMAYGVAIAGKTEEYWCGIKHQRSEGFEQPAHHETFLEYGDEEGYTGLNHDFSEQINR